METTVFNPIQRYLLEMFSYDKSQEGLEELKEVLFQYYSKRMNTKLDELWDKGILDQKKLDEIAEMELSIQQTDCSIWFSPHIPPFHCR